MTTKHDVRPGEDASACPGEGFLQSSLNQSISFSAGAEAMRSKAVEILSQQQKKYAEYAGDPKLNDEQQEIWASLANEKLDDMRALSALPLPSEPRP